MSFQIDLDRVLETAEGLYLQLSTFKNIPIAITEILNIPTADIKYKDNDDTELNELSALCLNHSKIDSEYSDDTNSSLKDK
jgi:hypothetical protein